MSNSPSMNWIWLPTSPGPFNLIRARYLTCTASCVTLVRSTGAITLHLPKIWGPNSGIIIMIMLFKSPKFLVNLQKIIPQAIFFSTKDQVMKIYSFYTDSTKVNRPEHNIRMYWTNLRQPTAHVQQNIFGKTPKKTCSLHLYASFGTFCVQIGQLFAP